jgi:pSer/pThr/pTyr-binding forkhead associated (FHA) protein
MTNLITKKTAKLPEYRPVAPPPVETIDIGVLRPWRIGLLIKQIGLKIIADITETITIGRSTTDIIPPPFIDLRPFGAEALGVSRKHLHISLEGDTLYIEDNRSANGTFLNGQKLEPNARHAVRHGDEISLGLMEIEVEFLFDPLS